MLPVKIHDQCNANCKDNYIPRHSKRSVFEKETLLKCEPKYDVGGGSDVLSAKLFQYPVRPRRYSPLLLTRLRKSLEIPRLAFEKVRHSVATAGHHHLGTRLRQQSINQSISSLLLSVLLSPKRHRFTMITKYIKYLGIELKQDHHRPPMFVQSTNAFSSLRNASQLTVFIGFQTTGYLTASNSHFCVT